MNGRYVILFALLLLVAGTLSVSSAPPDGYYSSINGKQGETLKSALGSLTRAKFTTLYDYGKGKKHTWDALYQTDRNESDNSVIDMYSNNKRYFNPSDPTASVKDCDIEHMFPNSWWGAKAGCKEAYCDLHHLVPADYSANRSKSNHGPGIPVTISFNNGVWLNGKDANGISVFCPPDEYKGDFARALMYIAMTYGDTVTWQKDESVPHMDNDSWQEFKPATRDLLLTWHRNDPVSQKELVRMEKVYAIQGNRNPFIDYPCLAEYIWGTHQGETVTMANLTSPYNSNYSGDGCVCSTDPTLSVSPASLTMDPAAVGGTSTKTFTVIGANLTGNISISISGSYYSVSPTTIAVGNANGMNTITVTFHPTATGTHNATITVSSIGVDNKTIAVTGTCTAVCTATWMANGSQFLQNTDASGAAPSMPSNTPSDCSATRKFIGWTAQSGYSGNTAPSDLFTTTAPKISDNTTFYAVYADASSGSGAAGSEVYTFSSKAWDADPEGWESGEDGYRYKDGQGVWVSTSSSGANATCPASYNDIRTVVVNYCTNGSSGAGEIVIAVGGTTKTISVTKEGGTTLRDATFDFTSAPKSGAVKITVNVTTNSIYINSVTINHGTSTTYSNYSLQCSAGAPTSVTTTFMNNGAVHATRSGNTGDAIAAVDNPDACDGYTFEGWSTHTYSANNTAAPTIDYTGVFTATDKTYYAVYRKTDGSGGSGGAEAGTTLWAENFTGFEENDIPTSSTTNTTIYGGSSALTYSCSRGSNISDTRIPSGQIYAGGASPELMIVSKNGAFTIEGLPTGNASVMTLSFKSNKYTDILTVSSDTEGITIGEPEKNSNTITCDITNNGNSTFNLTIKNVNKNKTNARVDDFSLTVKDAAAGSGTTYHTTETNCNCQFTIRVTKEGNGEASVL